MDEDGRWTNIGANGRVFAFEIYEEYRSFPHEKKVNKFARKRVETTKFITHLEKANLQNVQNYNDKHIVKLTKADSLDNTINLIFPPAKTNLDHLLRDPEFDYASSRGGQLEACDAWKQLLGIAKALSKIAGVLSDVAPAGSSREIFVSQRYGLPLRSKASQHIDRRRWHMAHYRFRTDDLYIR
ncbi:hypothetical protein K469DRAFT_781263 [Zopfia rhizophila CBS 207.26]|uniref:Protein kinase domain-containing protein n=1 Tax=Zopfia rhizophila CBS 207.26 TaxID=1314779 RepID=A0A6A6DYL9_9PEZI|nr:hypothetical protein K469DRAFT_781263 [Zopfia rhizophila CBS 207.26]